MEQENPHPDDYKVTLKIRIDWSEMDVFGHVNNVMFAKYMQAGRVNYWEVCGLTGQQKKSGLGPMVASISCQYKRPLFYPGNITVKTRIDFIGNTSFGFSHLILNDNGEIAAIGNDVVVLFDFRNNQKAPLPDWLREKFEAIEKGTSSSSMDKEDEGNT